MTNFKPFIFRFKTRDSAVSTATRQWLRRFGDRILGESRDFSPLKNTSSRIMRPTQLAIQKYGSSFPEVNGLGRGVAHSPHPVPTLK
jgi:hypothetical protein